jgi:hypothetical protein
MSCTINASTSAGLISSADTSGSLQLQTNSGTTAVTIDTSQNVGIGTTSPTTKVQVSVATGGSGSGLSVVAPGNMLQIFGASSANAGVVLNATDGTYLSATGVPTIFRYGGTESMRIDTSGRLGIGTSSPSYKLEVATGTESSGQVALTNIRTASSTASYNAGLQVFATASSTATSRSVLAVWDADGADAAGGDYFYIQKLGNSGDVSLFQSSNANILFSTNGAERMRIDSSGNLLVGTTSAVAVEKLNLTTSSGGFTQRIYNSNASTPFGIYVNYSNGNPNNTSSEFLRGDSSTGIKFQALSNGGMANFSANNVNLSDSREKINSNLAGNYLAKICATPVRTYNYIDQNLEEDNGLTLGVFAQDLQAVAPELVMESNWASEGQEPKMRLSIYQTDLQYALMKAIQELNTLITAQAAEITALKAKVGI